MAAANMTYDKSRGYSNMDGHMFEVKMSALLFLRGVNSEQHFQLASNVVGAVWFDDLVFRYRSNTDLESWHTLFLHLKHKQGAEVHIQRILRSHNDFSICKYFKSYLTIAEAMAGEVVPELFNGPLDLCRCVIYTNASASHDLQARTRSNIVTEELAFIRNNRDTEVAIKFNENDGDVVHFLGEYNVTHIQQFLQRLVIYTGAPSLRDICDLIQDEILRLRDGPVNFSKTDAEDITSLLVDEFIDWHRNSNNILDQNSDILRRAIYKHTVNRMEPIQRASSKLPIKFNSNFTADFEGFVVQNRGLLHIDPSRISKKISCSKLLQTLDMDPDKPNFIFTGLRCLLDESDAFTSVWKNSETKNVLVIVVDTESYFEIQAGDEVTSLESRAIKDICIVLALDNKRAICVGHLNDRFITRLGEALGDRSSRLQDVFELSHLEDESLTKILEKLIVFQGGDVEMGSLVGIEGLSPELVNYIVDPGMNTVIGKTLATPNSAYIERTLWRKNYVEWKIFHEKINGKFAISGVTRDDLRGQVTEETRDQFEILNSDDLERSFDRLCETFPTTTVHWLHVDDKKLTWKKTRGEIDDVQGYIDDNEHSSLKPSSAVDIEDRVILLVAEPGMGKSTLITHLAQKVKVAHPSYWVVTVPLKDHFNSFNKNANEDFRPETFLTSAVCADSPTPHEVALFEHNLLVRGNVVLMLDGFDEIDETCKENFKQFLTYILSTKVKKVWITTRYVVKDDLEKHLSTICLLLPEFSTTEPEKFLEKTWADAPTTMTKDQQKVYRETLLKLVTTKLKDKSANYGRKPIETKMIADVFLKDYSNPGPDRRPSKAKLDELYKEDTR